MNRIFSVTSTKNIEVSITEALEWAFAQTWEIRSPDGSKKFIKSDRLWELGEAVSTMRIEDIK
jgi:hypothetical protein